MLRHGEQVYVISDHPTAAARWLIALNLALNDPSEAPDDHPETSETVEEPGTRYRTRTCDQGIKSPLLYQLS